MQAFDPDAYLFDEKPLIFKHLDEFSMAVVD